MAINLISSLTRPNDKLIQEFFLVGADDAAFTSLKPSTSNLAPSVLFSFPENEESSDLLPFIFPEKLNLESQAPPVRYFSFCRTDVDGARSYLHSVIFHEQVILRFPSTSGDASPFNPDNVLNRSDKRFPEASLLRVAQSNRSSVTGRDVGEIDSFAGIADGAYRKTLRHKPTSIDSDSILHTAQIHWQELEEEQELYIPVALCMTTKLNHHDAMKQVCVNLFEILNPAEKGIYRQDLRLRVMELIEHVVFLRSLPPPLPGLTLNLKFPRNKTVTVGETDFKLIHHRESCIATLFQCLNLETIILLWRALLMERQIILISSQTSLLMAACEALMMLLFPFEWIYVYVPVLPGQFLEYLDSPSPYLIGIQNQMFEILVEQYPEVCVCDLNTGRCSNIGIPNLSDNEEKKMITKLQYLKNPNFFNFDNLYPTESLMTFEDTDSLLDTIDNIRLVFLRVFKNFLYNYREFITEPIIETESDYSASVSKNFEKSPRFGKSNDQRKGTELFSPLEETEMRRFQTQDFLDNLPDKNLEDFWLKITETVHFINFIMLFQMVDLNNSKIFERILKWEESGKSLEEILQSSTECTLTLKPSMNLAQFLSSIKNKLQDTEIIEEEELKCDEKDEDEAEKAPDSEGEDEVGQMENKKPTFERSKRRSATEKLSWGSRAKEKLFKRNRTKAPTSPKKSLELSEPSAEEKERQDQERACLRLCELTLRLISSNENDDSQGTPSPRTSGGRSPQNTRNMIVRTRSRSFNISPEGMEYQRSDSGKYRTMSTSQRKMTESFIDYTWSDFYGPGGIVQTFKMLMDRLTKDERNQLTQCEHILETLRDNMETKNDIDDRLSVYYECLIRNKIDDRRQKEATFGKLIQAYSEFYSHHIDGVEEPEEDDDISFPLVMFYHMIQDLPSEFTRQFASKTCCGSMGRVLKVAIEDRLVLEEKLANNERMSKLKKSKPRGSLSIEVGSVTESLILQASGGTPRSTEPSTTTPHKLDKLKNFFKAPFKPTVREESEEKEPGEGDSRFSFEQFTVAAPSLKARFNPNCKVDVLTLNYMMIEPDMKASPLTIVSGALSKLINLYNLYEDHLSNPLTRIHTLSRMKETEEFHEVCGLLGNLCKAPKIRYDDNQFLEFFLNLHNCMILHALVFKEQTPNSKSLWLQFRSKTNYQISEQTLTPLEVHYSILKSRYDMPIHIAKSLQSCEQNSKMPRPRKVERLIDFGLFLPVQKGLPVLRKYSAENVKSQLQANFEQFIESEMKIDLLKKTIRLPGVFKEFSEDNNRNRKKVLKFILNNLNGPKKKDLKTALSGGRDFDARYDPIDWKIDLSLGDLVAKGRDSQAREDPH
eukprot:CAMPEP_0115026206 /NCGR_PEP_ID=MMETSP0216-20121206/34579_1 /TAXON_ID=223996 /ORGANISM="Protocruzia adherens, Strain Boccale" /LENGTH=1339 /DNA_ID=CAMNT_0002401179 /DNA_START=321 /DNA_END=4340 /DNA_ORIENTATION=-